MATNISAKKREKTLKLDAFRKEGGLVAVIYGQGKEALPIQLDRREFIRMYREAGDATLINLDVEGSKHSVLVQDIQLHPVHQMVLHVDFKEIEAGKMMEVEVPIVFTGEAPAEKEGLGVLAKAMEEIEIEVLPENLPSEIEISVSEMRAVGDKITAGELILPAGVVLITDPSAVLVSISEMREEVEEEEAPAEIDFSKIEVQEKGKKTEEESDDK